MHRGRTRLLHDDRGQICAVQPRQHASLRAHCASVAESLVICAIVAAVLLPALYYAIQQSTLWIAIPVAAAAATVAYFFADRSVTIRRRTTIERTLL